MMLAFALNVLLRYWKPLGLLIFSVGLLTGAYWKGYAHAYAACQSAGAQARIASLERDLAAQQAGDAEEARSFSLLETEKTRLTEELAAYEADLARRPLDARCALDDADVRLDAGRMWHEPGKPARTPVARPPRLYE